MLAKFIVSRPAAPHDDCDGLAARCASVAICAEASDSTGSGEAICASSSSASRLSAKRCWRPFSRAATRSPACLPRRSGRARGPTRWSPRPRNESCRSTASRNTPTPEALEALEDLNADIGVMAYVLLFAPPEFCAIPKHGMIQFHPSLLPLHRGPASIPWAIIRGRSETGLSIFRPTPGLDEGPVILQKRVRDRPERHRRLALFRQDLPARRRGAGAGGRSRHRRPRHRMDPGRGPGDL